MTLFGVGLCGTMSEQPDVCEIGLCTGRMSEAEWDEARDIYFCRCNSLGNTGRATRHRAWKTTGGTVWAWSSSGLPSQSTIAVHAGGAAAAGAAVHRDAEVFGNFFRSGIGW